MSKELTSSSFYFRSIVPKNLRYRFKQSSHLAKDCGELIAAMGAVITFSRVFYEPFLHDAFKYIFLSYMYGQILGYILTVITNYLKSSEEIVNAPLH